MKIVEKMARRASDNAGCEGVTIALLGDSVTQGCFELYKKGDGVETVFDPASCYGRRLADMLAVLFPSVPVNILNAGISGDRSASALARLERDVLRHEPDLVVVCFGLNECGCESQSPDGYAARLGEIFDRIIETGAEAIYLTPNRKNDRISPTLLDHPTLHKMAEYAVRVQNDGTFDRHIAVASEMCRQRGVPVCDCYAIWCRLAKAGVDTTELLSNRLNHPIRPMHTMFAYELIRTMIEN